MDYNINQNKRSPFPSVWRGLLLRISLPPLKGVSESWLGYPVNADFSPATYGMATVGQAMIEKEGGVYVKWQEEQNCCALVVGACN